MYQQEQDHQMSDSSRGQMSTPGRSPRNRNRSASPRTLQRDRGPRRRDTSTPEWKWNPALECVVHSASACTTCRDYVSHLNEGAMDDDASYIDAGMKRSASYVSITQWTATRDDLSRVRQERESLRDRLHDAERELHSLREGMRDLETRLQGQKTAPSYSAVTKSQRPAQAPAKRTNVVSKPTFILKVTESPQGVVSPVVPPTTKASNDKAPALPPAVPPTANKSKGKAPALPTMDYEASLAYDDDEWGSDSDPTEDAADEAKAVNSKTGQLIVAILNGSVPTRAVGPSGSNSVEGRVPDIRPASNAEFRLALRALEQAHAENNVYKGNLLSSIRQYISTCHKAPKKTKVQLSSINQWRAPDWAEKVKYDRDSGLVIPSGLTKEQDRDKRAKEERDGPTKQARIFLKVSNRLGLTVNGVPDKRLGNISSPRHEDHPLLWTEWCAKITYKHPKGITLNHTGRPYERVIRGFRQIAPFFKEKKGNGKPTPEDAERRVRGHRGQIFLMGLLAATRRYDELIAEGGLTILPTPSWEAIDFSNDVDEMECARHLATRGVTSDEALDASQYAFTWLEHSDASEKDTQVRILINNFRDRAKYRPEAQPWPDHLDYYYHTGLTRWMPILPAAGTTSSVAPNISASTISGGTATPSLTGSGNPSLQPHHSAVPLATPVASADPEDVTFDENVEMTEPHDEAALSLHMDTDNS
jgi:hypothetical protein